MALLLRRWDVPVHSGRLARDLPLGLSLLAAALPAISLVH
jgi:hypothetical protein